MRENLSEEKIREALPAALSEIPLFVYPEVGSTSDVLKAMPEAAHGTTVLAEQQSAGRGRYGRSFYSPRQSGLYLSMFLRLEHCEAPELLTIAAAVAAARATERISGKTPKIKWVNDLYWAGKKVCGILAELTPQGVVLGIGINCTAQKFPEPLQEIAGSLDLAPEMRNPLAAEIISEVLTLCPHAGDRQILEEYRARSLMLGRQVRYERDGEPHTALVLGIADDGGLHLCEETGVERTLHSGEVRFLNCWDELA